jgi:acetaldehyde dehydrogenase/alcohol dehydrogenase
MAHKIGAEFHVTHGLANAILLPYVIKFNSTNKPTKQGCFPQYKRPEAKTRYAKVADLLNLGGKTEDEKVDRLIKAIQDLMKELNVPMSFKELNIDKDQFYKVIDTLSEKAFDDQCTGANPRYPLISEIKQMYIDAFEGNEIK